MTTTTLRKGALGSQYEEYEGKEYVRMLDVDGLETQLAEKTAVIEWYILTHHSPNSLLEFGFRKKRSKKTTTFRVSVPREKITDRLLLLLVGRA